LIFVLFAVFTHLFLLVVAESSQADWVVLTSGYGESVANSMRQQNLINHFCYIYSTKFFYLIRFGQV